MPVAVAEYLGQRTDVDQPIILPVQANETPLCPFMANPCTKVQQGSKPVCAVRKTNGEVWLVCRHRLCATLKKPTLSNYQRDILQEVAATIFAADVRPDEVFVRREVPVPITKRKAFSADFVMQLYTTRSLTRGPKRVILEMQGGGETSNTGRLTRHIIQWEQSEPNNALLAKYISGVGTIEGNAWRRQQEQFLLKGSVALRTGDGIVFCVGAPLYDYLWDRIRNANLRDMRDYSWSLALIGYSEDKSRGKTSGAIPYRIDPKRTLFTDYLSFVNHLINQGEPHPEIFTGLFDSLANTTALF